MIGIEVALNQMFNRHRIVFWYDGPEELREQYESLELRDVTKVTVQPGQFFGLKYRVLRESPDQRFLLYCPFKVPSPHENGLLDIQEAYGIFRADKASMYLQELGLGLHLHDTIKDHLLFFENKERRKKLGELVQTDISATRLKMEMLSVIFNTFSTALEDFIPAYSHEVLLPDKFTYTYQLDRYELADFFWEEIGKAYGYSTETHSIYDFILFLFANGFGKDSSSPSKRDILILLSGWQDSSQHSDVFREVSRKASIDLNIRDRLYDMPIEHIVQEDLFPVIENYLIEEWSTELCKPDPHIDEIVKGLKTRQNRFWYETYKAAYRVIEAACRFFQEIESQDYKITDFQDGVDKYVEVFSSVDFYYRKFIHSWQQAQQNQLFEPLYEKITRAYSNEFLLELSRSWQRVIDKTEQSNILYTPSSTFFDKEIRKFVDKDQRIFVIISDAFRYEIGKEFLNSITKENRYQAELTYRVSPFPSYTQLGMAALLPHQKLEIQAESDAVLVDGVLSQGLDSRKKIIGTRVKGTAINAADLIRLSRDEGREFVKDYNVVYIFHNRIDKTGDDKTTESKVFESVGDELDFLLDLIKSIAGFNGVNMILTADHGFIYDHNSLHESEFLTSIPTGKIWKKNRRFVIGQDLEPESGFNIFKGESLGLQEGIQVAFPKELNRIRISGSGSQYVHGGLSLQEIVVPLLRIRKLRSDTVSQTQVDIIHQNKEITNNVTPVHFIQSDAVGAGVLPRTLKAYFKGPDDEVLTDIFEKTFESQESENRNREVVHYFHFLSKASTQYRNQKIQLVLEEPIEGSTRYKVYKKFDFRMRTTMERDF